VRAEAPDWEATYRPLLGRALEGAAWLPMWSDTPDVVRQLDEPTIGFSGAVCLGFEDRPDLFLTWAQLSGLEFGLVTLTDEADGWNKFALDRVHMGYAADWDALRSRRLAKVDLYTAEDVEGGHVIAASHAFETDSDSRLLWVCTAWELTVSSGDDLLVSIEREPASSAPLKLVDVIR
jgi:hypothetical protein